MTPETARRPSLSYWIDTAGTILRVEGPWESWMPPDEQVPDSCRADRVVGRPLYSYIQGQGVRAIFQALQTRVMETGVPIEFASRCDSPSLMRELRIRLSVDGRTLRYDSSVIAERRRAHPLPWPVEDTDTIIAMCSFCKQYRFPVETENWKELDTLFVEPHLPDRFSVSHGICRPCTKLWYPDF
jgi:hypothetical protein